MNLYQKVIAVVGMLRNSISERAAKTDLAPLFSDSDSYSEGNLVIHDNVLYRCTADHIGAWDSRHFAATTIAYMLSNYRPSGGSSGGSYSGSSSDSSSDSSSGSGSDIGQPSIDTVVTVNQYGTPSSANVIYIFPASGDGQTERLVIYGTNLETATVASVSIDGYSFDFAVAFVDDGTGPGYLQSDDSFLIGMPIEDGTTGFVSVTTEGGTATKEVVCYPSRQG